MGNLLPLLLNPSEEKAAGGAEMCEEAAQGHTGLEDTHAQGLGFGS